LFACNPLIKTYYFNTRFTGIPIVFKIPVRIETQMKLKKLECFALSTENFGLRKSFPFPGFEFLLRRYLQKKQ